MKKVRLFLFLLQALTASVFAEEPAWEKMAFGALDLRAVLIPPHNSNVIYAGARSGVFKSQDGGKSWRMVLSLPAAAKGVKALSFGEDKNLLYAATGKGFYFSPNQGENWRKVFSGRNYLEQDCTAILVLPGKIFLGTEGGLFISRDNGRGWNKESGQLKNARILAIAGNEQKGDLIYLASSVGVFRSRDGGKCWDKIFLSRAREITDSNETPPDYRDEEMLLSEISYIAVDAQNPDSLYIGTTKGVYQSKGQGVAWQPLPEYGLLDRKITGLFVSPDKRLYAVTASGIFLYNGSRWQELSFGLVAGQARFLAWDSCGNLYVACDSGLFRSIVNGQSNNPVAREGSLLVLSPEHGPSIRQVQEKAIEYAEVSPEKIISWRKNAAKKAWLPKLTTAINRNSSDLWHWETGSTTRSGDDVLVRGRDSLDWDVSLSWDLSGLIWSDDQTNIDVRSRLMVELRDDVLDEVTKLYFERIRVKMELDSLSIEDRKKRYEKELKLQELTAQIDGLTGGYFSSQIKEKF